MTNVSRRDLIRGGVAVTSGLAASGLSTGAAAPTGAGTGPLPPQGEFILRSSLLMTMDPATGDIAGGDVHVKDGQIVAVGRGLQARGAEILGGPGMIVLPGLVETHWHMWNTLLRSFSGDTQNLSYFPMVIAMGKYWGPGDNYQGTRLGAVEALNSGITTVHNWSHMLPAPAFADAELRALADAGIRARFSYGWSPLLPLTEPLPLADIERLHKNWSDLANGGLIHLGLATRGMWYQGKMIPEAVYRSEFEFARRLGIPISMHVPGVRNNPEIIKMHAEHGFITHDILIAHCTWATADEIHILATNKTSASLCPVTDSRVGYGFPPTSELIAGGVNCCLSIDTAAVTGQSNLFETMKYLVNLENGRAGSEFKFLPRKALELATINGARALGLEDQIGSITPGKRADLIMVSTDALNMAVFTDPAHLLVEACQPVNVEAVVVDGRILKRDGKLVHIDTARVIAEASAAVNSVRQRSNWRL